MLQKSDVIYSPPTQLLFPFIARSPVAYFCLWCRVFCCCSRPYILSVLRWTLFVVAFPLRSSGILFSFCCEEGRYLILCPFMMIVFDYVGMQINKCISCAIPLLAARWNIHINEKHVKRKKITDIAQKMFNFPFCLSVRKPRLFFVKKTLSFIWYIFILMSRDLCRNEDLYLHKKLDGMFVFVSLRHHTTLGLATRTRRWRKRPMTIKFTSLTILEIFRVASLLWRTNIVISMKFLNGAGIGTRTYVSACHLLQTCFLIETGLRCIRRWVV